MARVRALLGLRAVRAVAVVAVALAAAALAVPTVGGTRADVGPLTLDLRLVPAARGDVLGDLAPVGHVRFDTHAGPLRLRVGVEEVRAGEVAPLLSASPAGREALTADATAGVRDLVLRSALVGVLAAAVACALVFHRWRAVVGGAASAAVGLAACGGLVAASFRTEAVTEPQYDGLLTQVPVVLGVVADVGDAVDAVTAHGRRLGELAAGVAQLYSTLSEPLRDPPADAVRVLHVSDVHNNPAAYEVMATVVDRFDVAAVLDTGDSTDLGTAAEDALHTRRGDLGVPYVWVRGNHDSAGTQAAAASTSGVTVLDGGPGGSPITEVAGLRVAGTGDPRYTPVKQVVADDGAEDELAAAGGALAGAVRASPEPVHVALVHEPSMAPPLRGVVPLVLDGHVHERRCRADGGTLELTQGSSGGAGLRSFDGGRAQPLELSVLHFDAGSGALLAVDDLTLSGPGQRSVSVERHEIADADGGGARCPD